jgi:hypothetical protein
MGNQALPDVLERSPPRAKDYVRDFLAELAP